MTSDMTCLCRSHCEKDGCNQGEALSPSVFLVFSAALSRSLTEKW